LLIINSLLSKTKIFTKNIFKIICFKKQVVYFCSVFETKLNSTKSASYGTGNFGK